MFSKAIECLEQNVRKLIDYKRPSNTKQMKECKIFELKYGNKSCRMFENITSKVSSCLFVVFFFFHGPVSLPKMSLLHRCSSNILLVKTNYLVYPYVEH